MTVKELLNKIKSILHENSIDNSENEAYFIMEKSLSLSRTDLVLSLHNTVSSREEQYAISIAERRIEGVPIQYCIGEWDFYGETYKVGEGVLIPRPETEELCEIVINELKNRTNSIIIDLCSGSGCIGITLKRNIPDATVFLVEKSDKALSYLRENVSALCKNQFMGIIHGDVLRVQDFEGLLDKADVIVSNPPYIKTEEIPELQKEVQHEPRMALDGGEDGYDFYRVICKKWHRYLKKGGLIALECGEEQANYICSLFDENLFETEIFKDFNGVDRFVLGRKKTE